MMSDVGRRVAPLEVERARAEVERDVERAIMAGLEYGGAWLHAAPPGLGKTRAALQAVARLVDGLEPGGELGPRPRGVLVVWVARGRAGALDVVQALQALGLSPSQAVYALGRGDGRPRGGEAGAPLEPGAPLGLSLGRAPGTDAPTCGNPEALEAGRAGVRLEGVCGRGCAWAGGCYARPSGWGYGTAGAFQRAALAARGVWSLGSACVVVPDTLALAALEWARVALGQFSHDETPIPARVLWVWDDADPLAFLWAEASAREVRRALAGVEGLEGLWGELERLELAAVELVAGARAELAPLPSTARRAVARAARERWSPAEVAAGVAYGRAGLEVLKALASGSRVEAQASRGGGAVLHVPLKRDWSGSGRHVVLSATTPRALWGFLGLELEVVGEGLLPAHRARVRLVVHEDLAGRSRLRRLGPREASGVARTLAREWARELRAEGGGLPPGPQGRPRVLLVGPLGWVDVPEVRGAFALQLGRELGVEVEVGWVSWGGADVAGSNAWEGWEACALVVVPLPNPHTTHRAHGLGPPEVEADPEAARALEGAWAAGEMLQGFGRLRAWTRPEGAEVVLAVGRHSRVPRALFGLEGPPLELVEVGEVARALGLNLQPPTQGRPPGATLGELARALEGWGAWSLTLDRVLGLPSGALARFLAEPSNLPPGWSVRRRVLTGQRGRAAEWVGPSEGAILGAALEAGRRLGRELDPARVKLAPLELERDGLELDGLQAPPPGPLQAGAEGTPPMPPLPLELERLWGAAGGAWGRARLEAGVGRLEVERLERERLEAGGAPWSPPDVAALARARPPQVLS